MAVVTRRGVWVGLLLGLVAVLLYDVLMQLAAAGIATTVLCVAAVGAAAIFVFGLLLALVSCFPD